MQIDLSNRGLQAFSPGELSGQTDTEAALMHVTGLNLSRNSLGSVRGLQGFTYLTVLDLSFNGLDSLDGGLPLSIISLNVSHNNLTTLQGGALYPLQKLAVLNVACNRLVDLRGVSSGAGTPSLRVLDASGNQLSSLNGIERCRGLEELRVEANLIKEAANVASLRQLPRLRTFTIKDNPLLLRKRQVQALVTLLPAELRGSSDVPAPSAVPSVNTSVVSASTAATAEEVYELSTTSRERLTRSPRTRTVPGTLATPVSAQQRTPNPKSQHSPRPAGTSPLSGVGGDEVSPMCPRRPLPETPPPVPPLQPYYVPPAGVSDATQVALLSSSAVPADPAVARMMRSSLLERVVGPAGSLNTSASVAVPASAPAVAGPSSPPALTNRRDHPPSSHRTPSTEIGLLPYHQRGMTDAIENLKAERDAYKEQVEELAHEVARLQEALQLERENTAVVLCINEQLQQRLQQALAGRSGAPKPQEDTASSTFRRETPPLAPPPAPLPPAPPQSTARSLDTHHARLADDSRDGDTDGEDSRQSIQMSGHAEPDESETSFTRDTGVVVAGAGAGATTTAPPRETCAIINGINAGTPGPARSALAHSPADKRAEALAARQKAAALMAKLRPSALA